MPTNNYFTLMNEFNPLAAYGEYTEEIAKSPVQKGKIFVPVNHLADEKSLYLSRQADSPVGWYSWGNEAFDIARHEDRPVFLNIGYSSNHWCSVMDKECFMNSEVAGMINDAFIPVRADREEYPELDNLFMETCRIQNGSAGWPLNIFLTPEGKPFFCTTWLPRRTTGQMPGLTVLLPRVKWLWHMQREDIYRAVDVLAESVKSRFDVLSGTRYRGGKIKSYTAYSALDDMRKIFDVRWGGFGHVPKFPEATKLLFLLGLAKDNSGSSKRDKSDAFTMTDITLRRMWRGGIHDHLGGGFSRYAIDERWLVPHFEKLLCDQAMILLAASLAQEIKANSFHRLIAEDIIFSVTRDFPDNTSYSQGFRSAIDGDTSDGEGRYYLWTEDEIKRILPEGNSGLFCAAYAVLPSGNFGNEVAGSQMGWNILYEASTVTDLAKRYGIKAADVGGILYECRKLLLDYRDKRYPLNSDNKILMNWNGLIIGALAHASVAFEQSEWRDIAERSALFIQKNFHGKTGSWFHVWLDGKAYIPATLEDYAYFMWGITELYKSAKHFNAGEKQLNDWLNCAKELADIMINSFWDEKYGGFFMASDDNIMFARMKSAEDMNSLPSANALASMALNELAQILEEKNYSDYARKINECFSYDAKENPLSYLSLITAALSWQAVKKKPEPEPEPVPTDEELNREEPVNEAQHDEPEIKHTRSSRASRHSGRERNEGRNEGRENRTAQRRAARKGR